MDGKWNRTIEERLARIERFERARYHRKTVIMQRLFFALVMVCGMILAAGLGRLM